MNNWSDVSLALPCCFAISIGSCIRCGEQSLFVPEQDRTLSEIGLQNNTLSERVMDYQVSVLERAFHVICEFRPACGINCSFPLGLDRHESPGTRTLFFRGFWSCRGRSLEPVDAPAGFTLHLHNSPGHNGQNKVFEVEFAFCAVSVYITAC